MAFQESLYQLIYFNNHDKLKQKKLKVNTYHIFHMEPCKCIFLLLIFCLFSGRGNNDVQVLNFTVQTDAFYWFCQQPFEYLELSAEPGAEPGGAHWWHWKQRKAVEVSHQKRPFCFAKLLDKVADGNSFFSLVTMRFFQALSHLSLIVSTVHRPMLSSAVKSP